MPVDLESFPVRETRQSRRLSWDPFELDFGTDRGQWATLSEVERDFALRMVTGFLIGERGVTHDLAPLQQALRRERGRMEEEMYLTTQLFEEARHVEFFQRWMDEVLPGIPGRDIPFPQVIGDVFSKKLPVVMQALLEDRSPRAQLRASTMYHMIVEGVLAEAGYRIFFSGFDARGLFPGLVAGIRLIQRDEVRHIAFGNYFLRRLLRENPSLESAFVADMDEFRAIGREFVVTVFGGYPEGTRPFGLAPEEFLAYTDQLWESRRRQVLRGDGD